MMEAGADHLVLGCTHYPFLIPAIEQITHGQMVIIDPAPAVALQVFKVLDKGKIYDSQTDMRILYSFFATGQDTTLQRCYHSMAKLGVATEFFSYCQLS